MADNTKDFKDNVINEMSPLLDSLNVDIDETKIITAYEEERDHWLTVDEKFTVVETDDSDTQYEDDFRLSRELLLKSLDKAEKIMDETFQMIAIKATVLNLELGQESIKNLQQGVKTLTDLHNTHQTVKQKELKNKKEEGKGDEEEEKEKDKHTDKAGNKLTFKDN